MTPTIGSSIRAAIARAGTTIAAVARAANITDVTLRRLCAGETTPDLGTLEAVSKALGGKRVADRIVRHFERLKFS